VFIFQIIMNSQIKQEIKDQFQFQSQELRFTPFRTFNDFLLDATWSIPDVSDVRKLNNRIISNLIYYQTNYFVFGIALFLLVG